jgi:small subunit ribosomal protein S20
LRNRSVITRLRSMQKRARNATKLELNDLRALVSEIDRAAKRGIIHRNTARRRKSRLIKLFGAAGKK